MSNRLERAFALCVVLSAIVGCGGSSSTVSNTPTTPKDSTPTPTPTPPTTSATCDAGNGGITLPTGFCATIFADHIGTARHMAVSSSGALYVTITGGAILALRDTNADGHSDVRVTFGRNGNSGLALRGTDLFADVGPAIVRYRLTGTDLAPSNAATPDTIVKALPTGGHGTRSIAVDANGNLFVNVGSQNNICEGGGDPCTQLSTRAGIWQFSSTTVGQTFSSAARFATGIRNAVAITVSPIDGQVYALQHGRDNLFQSFPGMFTAADGAENPAEELFQVSRGDDFGWPYCYYDFRAAKRVLGPEFGGNRSTVGRCSSTKAAIIPFPGHWAPNGILFYTGTMFPARYRSGAFIAFHGSWNRAPQPQDGYRITFVPASGTSLGAAYETFAEGFAGVSPIANESQAAHRPTGLAIGNDGALYVGDDIGGRIWRIVYRP